MIIIDNTQSDKPYDTACMNWLLFKVDGIDRNKKYDGSSWTQMGIYAPSVTGSVAAYGSGTLTKNWGYAYTFVNDSTGHESNGLIIGTAALASASGTTISGLQVSSDAQVTQKNIYRTLTDGGVYFYLKTIDNTVTTTVDYASDASIDTNSTMATDNGVPPTAAYCLAHKQHLFLWGDGFEDRGKVAVVTGDLTVTGATTGANKTYFRPDMVGKYLMIGNDATRYSISSLDTTTQTVVLATAYAGATATTTFTVSGRPAMFAASEANRPEAFSDDYDLSIDGDEGTGIGSLYNDVYLFTRTKVYRWVYSDDPDPVDGDGTLALVNPTVGCLGHKTIVNAENTLFFANEHGVFALGEDSGGSGLRGVSDVSMPIRDRWKNDIDKTYFRRFHGVFRRQTNDLMLWVYEDIYSNAGFQVPDAQKQYPNVLYVFNLDTKTWARHENLIATCSLRDVDRYGDEHIAFEDGLGVVHEYGWTDYDGYELPTASVSSSNANTTTCASCTFPATGTKLIGTPVRIESGTGAGQIRRILDNSTTTFTVESAWTTTPTASSTISIGSIYTSWRSKMEDAGTPDRTKIWRFFHLTFKTASATGTQIRVRFLADQSLTPVVPKASRTYDDVSITSGDSWHVVNANRTDGNVCIEVGAEARFMTCEFDCHQPGKPVEILGHSWDCFLKGDK